MKILIGFAAGLTLSVLLTTVLGAQTAAKIPLTKNQVGKNMPDSDMNERLIQHLADKIPETKNESIAWLGTDYGYSATYSIDNVGYMTLYDRSGNYLETFSKQAWDDRVPDIIKMEFDNSAYNVCTVTGFWEGTTADNRHYYMEMMDKDGLSRYAWCDENGRFSEVPFVKN